MRKVVYVILRLVVLLTLYLLLWPVPIQPVGWTPSDNPGLMGPYQANDLLAQAELYALAGGHGPEDTALGPDGLIYTGLADGSIVRFSPGNGADPEAIASTGGRPLGVAFHGDRLYIADAFAGLLYIEHATTASGHLVQVATDEVGSRLRCSCRNIRSMLRAERLWPAVEVAARFRARRSACARYGLRQRALAPGASSEGLRCRGSGSG